MKEDFYGDDKNGFSGSLEYEGPQDGSLKPCPFCGDTNFEVWNTHSPSYSVKCKNCEAEMPGEYKECYGKTHTSLAVAIKYHKEAFNSAIKWWNTRV